MRGRGMRACGGGWKASRRLPRLVGWTTVGEGTEAGRGGRWGRRYWISLGVLFDRRQCLWVLQAEAWMRGLRYYRSCELRVGVDEIFQAA